MRLGAEEEVPFAGVRMLPPSRIGDGRALVDSRHPVQLGSGFAVEIFIRPTSVHLATPSYTSTSDTTTSTTRHMARKSWVTVTFLHDAQHAALRHMHPHEGTMN